jgi:hypothetical protein
MPHDHEERLRQHDYILEGVARPLPQSENGRDA